MHAAVLFVYHPLHITRQTHTLYLILPCHDVGQLRATVGALSQVRVLSLKT